MLSTTVIALAAVCGGIWYWQSNMRAKELANQKAKELCENDKVQFLDQSVTLKKLRFRRYLDGRMAFERSYHFDYATDDEKRYHGHIVIHGKEVTEAYLDSVNGVRQLNRVALTPSETSDKPADIIDFKKFKPPANDDSSDKG